MVAQQLKHYGGAVGVVALARCAACVRMMQEAIINQIYLYQREVDKLDLINL